MLRASAAGALVLALLLAGRVTENVTLAAHQPGETASPHADGQVTGAATEAEARSLCSVCHLFPPADILPRYAWRDEIARMALIRGNQPQPAGPAGTTGRMIVLPPDLQRVLRYY